MLRLTVRNVLTKISRHKSLAVMLSREQSSSESAEAPKPGSSEPVLEDPQPLKREESERIAEFRKKLKEDMAAEELNRYNLMSPVADDPLPPWPDNVNPHTGEVGGPRGPEPTRYGDWERKGICVDF